MHYLKLSHLKLAAARRPGLRLVPPGAVAPDPAALVAGARVRHALLRSVQEFLDRAGFTELAGAPAAALAAGLGRACWRAGDTLRGRVPGADGRVLVDLLERGLLAALHGTLSRAYSDLTTLGVDLDRLKYLSLPLRRMRVDDAEARLGRAAGLAGAVLAEAGEPVLLVEYSAAALGPDAPAPHLLAARILLPGGGLVASATADGGFHLDLAALTRFLCQAEVVVLARPALG